MPEYCAVAGRGKPVRVLIIAEPEDAARISDFLRGAGEPLSFSVAGCGDDLQRRIADETFDAVIFQQPLPASVPSDLLQRIGRQLPLIVVNDTGADLPGAHDPSCFVLSTRLDSLPWALCRVLHEKAKSEEEARQQEQAQWASKQWNETFDTVSESVMVLDAEHRIQRANRATAALLGVDLKELRGKRCYEIVHGSSAPPAKCPLQRMLRSGKVEREDIEEPQFNSTFDVIANPLVDAKGAPCGCVHVVRDISERARVERALRQSEEKYHAFFEQNLAGNYIATPGGHILDCNSAYLEMFGFGSVAEAMEADLTDLYPDRAVRQVFLQKLQELGHLEHYEKELKRKDGRPLYVHENALGVFDREGRLTEIRGFLINDTERRQAEMQLRQAQKMDALGRLAGGVAHDFNNLLTIINGFSEVLSTDWQIGEAGRNQAQQILDAGRSAARLTRQLLAFSRRQVLQPVLMDPNQVVSEIEKMVCRLLPEKITLHTDLEAGLPWVHADHGQIEQVIVNLVINARDAMPGGGQVTIETRSVYLDEASAREHGLLHPGQYVRLTVVDTGTGMDKATQAQIFEPFFTTKGAEQGTGLGLSTVYGIVQQSGGHVAVQSEVGVGSKFTVHLPAVAPRGPRGMARN